MRRRQRDTLRLWTHAVFSAGVELYKLDENDDDYVTMFVLSYVLYNSMKDTYGMLRCAEFINTDYLERSKDRYSKGLLKDISEAINFNNVYNIKEGELIQRMRTQILRSAREGDFSDIFEI